MRVYIYILYVNDIYHDCTWKHLRQPCANLAPSLCFAGFPCVTPHNELVKSYKSVGCVPPRLNFLFRTFDRLSFNLWKLFALRIFPEPKLQNVCWLISGIRDTHKTQRIAVVMYPTLRTGSSLRSKNISWQLSTVLAQWKVENLARDLILRLISRQVASYLQ